MKIIIKNGLVVDPANNINEILDILVEDDKIVNVGKNLKNNAATIIDATNRVVIPGIVDMHVHLREPGREDKETVASGTNAALKGGVTSVLAMPNTNPPIDSRESIQILNKIIKNTAHANVFICGAITKQRQGKELSDISGLKQQGAIAISDDGNSVDNAQLFLEALKIAKRENILVICHCEDVSLSAKGVVNLGITSTRMGLRGISRESEYTRLSRDAELAQRAKTPIHIAHISCRESVEIIAAAKKRGINITCETAPHYFSLTEEAVWGYDTNFKVNPPLRSRDDVESIKQALKSDVIDAIASDHAPHTDNEKDIEFIRAEFGTIGLETTLAVCITELIHTGLLDWSTLIRKLCLNPSKILGIKKGTLSVGSDADIIVVSPNQEWLVDKNSFVSKSKNSMFLGKTLKGVVDYTILGGKISYQRPLERKNPNEVSCEPRARKTC